MIKNFIEFLKEQYKLFNTDSPVQIYTNKQNSVPCFSEYFTSKEKYPMGNFSKNLLALKKQNNNVKSLRFFILFDITKLDISVVSWTSDITHEAFLTNLTKNSENISILKIPKLNFEELYRKYTTTPSKFDVPKPETFFLFTGLFENNSVKTSILSTENFNKNLEKESTNKMSLTGFIDI